MLISRLYSALATILLVAMILACGGNPSGSRPENSGTSQSKGVSPGMPTPGEPLVHESKNTEQEEAQKSKTYTIYAPSEEVICATDSAFLDSSPLLAPARFIRVPAGTELVQVGFGGLFGKFYWKLSAGGETTIYVYQDFFDSRFRTVRIIDPAKDAANAKALAKREGEEAVQRKSAEEEAFKERARVAAEERRRRMDPAFIASEAKLAEEERQANIKREAARAKAKKEADERDANALLAAAKKHLARGFKSAARNRLESILADFPAAAAAAEARELLDQLGK